MRLPPQADANIRSRTTDHGHIVNTGDLPETRSDNWLRRVCGATESRATGGLAQESKGALRLAPFGAVCVDREIGQTRGERRSTFSDAWRGRVADAAASIFEIGSTCGRTTTGGSFGSVAAVELPWGVPAQPPSCPTMRPPSPPRQKCTGRVTSTEVDRQGRLSIQ